MRLSDNLYFYPEFGMLDSNTIVIKDHINILIDIGSRSLFQNVVREMRKDGIQPEDIQVICNTHLHMDHYAACADFKKISGARILAHPLQKQFYNESVIQTARVFNMQPAEFKEDAMIDEKELAGGELELEIIAAPGHSLDSICFYSKPAKFMVCGDVIFNRNIGRVDLPGGDAGQLKTSIDALSRIDIDMLCPGHMDFVAGAAEVSDNFNFIKESVLAWL